MKALQKAVVMLNMYRLASDFYCLCELSILAFLKLLAPIQMHACWLYLHTLQRAEYQAQGGGDRACLSYKLVVHLNGGRGDSSVIAAVRKARRDECIGDWRM